MYPTHPPILLTSSVIAYDAGVKLKDTELRIKYAVDAIEKWLEISPESALVLCDGSSFDFSLLVQEKFPNAKIECLFFENNQSDVSRYGRGYGEGEIIRYAIAHSKFIDESQCFVKCSSKLWVKNYSNILNYWNGIAGFKVVFLNVFSIFKSILIDHIDTRFYMVNLDFYKTNLMDLHLEIANKKISLENIFLSYFDKNSISQYAFKIHPIIEGVGGGIGKLYKTTVIRKFKEFLKISITLNSAKFNHIYT